MVRAPQVHVTGDSTIDWQWIELGPEGASPHQEAWWGERRVVVSSYAGGAALLGAMLETASRLVTLSYSVSCPRLPDSVHPNDPHYHHSHMSCRRYTSKSDPPDHEPAWRVMSSLGLTLATERRTSRNQKDKSQQAKVVVVNDASLGFRNTPEVWPKAVCDPGGSERPWFVLKMAHPVADGRLWDHLSKTCAEQLVVVVEVDALRYGDVQVSRGVSWELTASDLYWELTHNPKVNALAGCAHVVVSFPTVGAFVLSSTAGRGDPKSTHLGSLTGHLFFDPVYIEDTWAEAHPGRMVGYTTCMAAAIAHQIVTSSVSPEDITAGV